MTLLRNIILSLLVLSVVTAFAQDELPVDPEVFIAAAADRLGADALGECSDMTIDAYSAFSTVLCATLPSDYDVEPLTEDISAVADANQLILTHSWGRTETDSAYRTIYRDTSGEHYYAVLLFDEIPGYTPEILVFVDSAPGGASASTSSAPPGPTPDDPLATTPAHVRNDLTLQIDDAVNIECPGFNEPVACFRTFGSESLARSTVDRAMHNLPIEGVEPATGWSEHPDGDATTFTRSWIVGPVGEDSPVFTVAIEPGYQGDEFQALVYIDRIGVWTAGGEFAPDAE